MTGARYVFRVSGQLSDRITEGFEGMTVRQVPTETVISGPIVDEAHLHGVLAQLQALGLHVISFQEIPD